MSELPVAVVGAGFAGVAAAFAAAQSGARVLVVHGTAGASALYSGIVDGPEPTAAVRSLGTTLGLVIASGPRAVASREGAVREALGRDRALLDLEPLAGRRIAVADFGRDDWDARLVARALESAAWARRTETRFVPVRVRALADGAERRIPAYDLAQRFDEAIRCQALATALASAAPDAEAWLTGPFLGVARDVAAQLSATLARPVGETSSAPGGAAGGRFEQRRDALFAELGVELRAERAVAVRAEASELRLELGNSESRRVRAVVLAVGGVVGGGLELSDASRDGYRAFRLSLVAPVELALDGEVCDAGSSLHGVSFARHGLQVLERVGIRTTAGVVAAAERPIFAAGDARSGSSHSVLAALASGIDAGRAAAS